MTVITQLETRIMSVVIENISPAQAEAFNKKASEYDGLPMEELFQHLVNIGKVEFVSNRGDNGDILKFATHSDAELFGALLSRRYPENIFARAVDENMPPPDRLEYFFTGAAPNGSYVRFHRLGGFDQIMKNMEKALQILPTKNDPEIPVIICMNSIRHALHRLGVTPEVIEKYNDPQVTRLIDLAIERGDFTDGLSSVELAVTKAVSGLLSNLRIAQRNGDLVFHDRILSGNNKMPNDNLMKITASMNKLSVDGIDMPKIASSILAISNLVVHNYQDERKVQNSDKPSIEPM